MHMHIKISKGIFIKMAMSRVKWSTSSLDPPLLGTSMDL